MTKTRTPAATDCKNKCQLTFVNAEINFVLELKTLLRRVNRLSECQRLPDNPSRRIRDQATVLSYDVGDGHVNGDDDGNDTTDVGDGDEGDDDDGDNAYEDEVGNGDGPRMMMKEWVLVGGRARE